jgi:hypothetical protein
MYRVVGWKNSHARGCDGSMVSRLRQEETDRAVRLKRVRGRLVRGRSLHKALSADGNETLTQYIERHGIERVGPDLRDRGEDESPPGAGVV